MNIKVITKLPQRFKLINLFVSTICLSASLAHAELVVYYNLDEPIGATSAEATSGDSAFSLQPLGGAINGSGAPGVFGNSWFFADSPSTRLRLNPAPSVLSELNSTDGWSYSAWFKTEADGVNTIMSISDLTAGSSEAALRVNLGEISFLGRNENGDNGSVTTGVSVIDNQWYHVALTSSTVVGTNLYLDGTLVGTNPLSTNIAGFNENTGAYEFNIGANNDSASGTQWQYQGFLDEISIYNHVLSQSEISGLAAVPETSLFSLILGSAIGVLVFSRRSRRA